MATQEELNQQILDAINALNSLTAASMTAAEAARKEAKEKSDASEKETALTKRLASEKEAAAKKEAEEQKKLNAKLDVAQAALGGAINAIGSYTKAVYKGELGAKAFSQSADDLSNAAKQAAVGLAVLMPGGPLMKGLVLALGFIASKFIELGKEAKEHTGKVYDAFQDVARAGANAGGGMQDVFDGLMKMGVGLEKFPEVAKMLEENASQLAGFAGTVGEGRHSVEDMVKGMRGMRTDFQMLGIDRTKLIDVSAQYLRVQGTLTRQTKENMDISDQAVMKYVKETDLLTRITGMSRKKQEEVMEKAMSEEMFGSFIDEMTDQGNQAAAKNLNTFNQLITSKIGPQFAQGFRDSMIAPGSEAAKQFLMSAGPAGQEIIQQLQQSGKELNAKELGTLMNKLAKEIDSTGKSFRPLRAIGGDVAKSFGPQSETRNAARVLSQNLEKAGEMAIDQQDKDLKGDEKTRKMAEVINKQQDEQINLQKAMNLQMGEAIDEMDALASSALKASEAILATAEALYGVTGKQMPGAAVRQANKELNQKTSAAQTSADTVKELKARGAPAAQVEEAQKKADEDAAAVAQSIRVQREAALKEANERRLQRKKENAAKIMGGKAAAGGEANQPTTGGAAEGVPGKQKDQGQGAQDSKQGSPMDGNATPPPETSDANLGDKPIAKVIDSESGKILVAHDDGSRSKRVGAANWRMNNPGNLRYTGWTKGQGAIGEAETGGSGKFAVFSTLEAGRRAKENLLFGSNTIYSGLDLKSAIYKYAPPTENATEDYLKSILDATGATQATKLADLTQAQRDAMLAAIEKKEGFKPGKIYAAAKGGIVKESLGGTLVQAGEAGKDEAFIPLENGAVPVHLDSTPTFAGYNEYKGYNQGPLSTDLKALEQIAGKLGAYDAATKTITDPKVWKEILNSGMLTNYNVGGVDMGTKLMGFDAGDMIGDRINEIIDNNKTDLSSALATVKEEFGSAMTQLIEYMKSQDNQGIQIQMLQTLQNISKTNASTANASEKMLRSSVN